MAARSWLLSAIMLVLITGCTAPAPQVKRIVLLAPFESTYREIGYDALYPVKLALSDEAAIDVQLLSVDDGGSIEDAVLRAQALAADERVYIALVIGPIATDSRVLEALNDIPIVVIGSWSVVPGEGVFVLASDAIESRLTSQVSNIYEAAALSEATGGELFGLKSYTALSPDTSNVTVLTSVAPPSPAFRERLLASDLYVPEPGLLATLAYDAGTLTSRIVSQSATRADVSAAISDFALEGLNGQISFDASGYWADAPVYEYGYADGTLRFIER